MTRDGSGASAPDLAAAPMPAPEASSAPSQTPASQAASSASPTWDAGTFAAAACTVVLTSVLSYEVCGFYGSDSAVIAFLACALAVVGLIRNRLRLPALNFASVLLLSGVCAVGVASAVSNGLSYVGLSSLGHCLVFAAVVCAAGTLRPAERRAAVTALAWVGVAISVFGILEFAGVGSFGGGVDPDTGGLVLFFGASEPAGAFFCVMGLLAIGSSSLRMRWAAFPSLAALTLTLSGSGAVVALASFGALAAIWAWRLDFRRFTALVVQALLAFAFCVAAFKGPSGWILPAAALGVCACALCGIIEWGLESRRRLTSLSKKPSRLRLLFRIVLVAAVVAAIAAVVACALVLFSDGVDHNVDNFIERVAQMHDAIVLWTSNPLFGIGPGGWQFEQTFVQCMFYSTWNVHCGYLDLACEFGTFAFVFFLAALVVLFCGLVRRLREARFDDDARNERLAVIVAVVALLVHIAFNCTFGFGGILLVLAILITPPSPSRTAPSLSAESDPQSGSPQFEDILQSATPSRRAGVFEILRGSVAVVLAVLMLAVSYVSYDADETHNQIIDDAYTDALSTLETVEADPLALADEDIVTSLLSSLSDAELYQEGIDFVEDCGGCFGWSQSFAYAECLYGVGRDEDAEEALIDALWAEPLNRDLFGDVYDIFKYEHYPLSEENEDAYHEAVAHANDLLTQGMQPLVDDTFVAMPEYLGRWW